MTAGSFADNESAHGTADRPETMRQALLAAGVTRGAKGFDINDLPQRFGAMLKRSGTALRAARYTAAQSLRVMWYGAHYAAARGLSQPLERPGEPAFRPSRPADLKVMREAFDALFKQDRANVLAGLYPAPDDLRLDRLPKAIEQSLAFFREVPQVDARRLDRRGVEVRDLPGSERYPTYYRQNFHYQSGGWLTEESAAIYDTQVEVLFTGAAGAMRRAVLAELARELKGKDQRGQNWLDLACGTGAFMRQTLEAFPRLSATGIDLSPAYCERARAATSRFAHTDIVEGMAEAMPFENDSFDLISNIYLFHELPPRVRPQVLKDVARVLKPAGLFVLADSLQRGDVPGLDGLLEYFPHSFHEPYYTSWLDLDLAPIRAEVGLVPDGPPSLAFLTKVTRWRKA
jgi:ubiquinone/menaquinone biosynthesis C-methylase UbiE